MSTGPTLRRAVSLPLLVLYGLGTILGAGIYVLIGEMAGVAGYGTPLSLALAASVAGTTAVSFACLSRRFPRSAGEAVYVQEGFGLRPLATLTGLGVVFIGMCTVATVTVGMVGYLNAIVPIGTVPAIIVTIAVLAAVASWGVGESVGIAGIITVIEIMGLLFVAAVSLSMSDLGGVPGAKFAPGADAAGVRGILLGSFLAFFAFIGFEDIVNLAEETREPRHTLPLAIAICLPVALGLYLLVSVAALAALPPDRLAASDAPLAAVVGHHLPKATPWISLVSIVAVLNGGLIQLIMGSRVLYGMAGEGLPRWFGVVHPSLRTPVNATLTLAVLVLGLALSGSVGQLARLTSTLTLLIFAMVNAASCAVHLRDWRREGPRSAALPLLVSALALLLCLALLVLGLSDVF